MEATGNTTADFDACIYPNAKCGSGYKYKKVICMQQYVDVNTGVKVTKEVADLYCDQHVENYFTVVNPNASLTMTREEFKT